MNERTLLNLLARNYIRWRHGLIGSQDQAVVDDTAHALADAIGTEDVSLLSDDEIRAAVSGDSDAVADSNSDAVANEGDPLLPSSLKPKKK